MRRLSISDGMDAIGSCHGDFITCEGATLEMIVRTRAGSGPFPGSSPSSRRHHFAASMTTAWQILSFGAIT